ncbi:hypothetical protein U1Q18_018904 [Sarracenia purpurea var. burkii]
MLADFYEDDQKGEMICKVAYLNRTFCGAASCDSVWETKLPHIFALSCPLPIDYDPTSEFSGPEQASAMQISELSDPEQGSDNKIDQASVGQISGFDDPEQGSNGQTDQEPTT